MKRGWKGARCNTQLLKRLTEAKSIILLHSSSYTQLSSFSPCCLWWQKAWNLSSFHAGLQFWGWRGLSRSTEAHLRIHLRISNIHVVFSNLICIQQPPPSHEGVVCAQVYSSYQHTGVIYYHHPHQPSLNMSVPYPSVVSPSQWWTWFQSLPPAPCPLPHKEIRWKDILMAHFLVNACCCISCVLWKTIWNLVLCCSHTSWSMTYVVHTYCNALSQP
jgi:hypothetical protein